MSKRIKELFDQTMFNDNTPNGVSSVQALQERNEVQEKQDNNEVQEHEQGDDEQDNIHQIEMLREQQLQEPIQEQGPICSGPIYPTEINEEEPIYNHNGINFLQDEPVEKVESKTEQFTNNKSKSSMYNLVVISLVGFIIFIILSLPYVNKIQIDIYKSIFIRGILFVVLFILISQLLL